ncbi:MAG: guanine deaminase [Rhizobiaceae bacterium]|nr:guanine deaminase [Hyphomicrobiales bacterium]NRB32741.1 guanine deaminase [Rhizobiaceae bacterium]
MADRLLRGRVLSFKARPESIDDDNSYDYFEDGAVFIRGDTIAAVGDYADLAGQAGMAEVIDHRPHLIMPGLIDTHNHLPQMQVIGSYGAQLLDWLNTYTFPAEAGFADSDHAERIAAAYFDEMLRNGTTTSVAYCSVHRHSADAYFKEAERRNMCVIGGKVMMDRNAIDAVHDTPQEGYDDTKALIAKWHGRGRAHYAITPRFAITSSPEQMTASQALVEEFPDCYVQTHLSENRKEIEITLDLYPDAKDYLGVYETYGLLGKKSLFGHSIYLSARERAAMAETGSVAVFCPTSNLFIGSGLFDEEATRKAGVRVAVATDIGGGTSCSMLRTMDEAYKILQLQNQNLNPLASFYMMTLGNAEALSLSAEIGTLAPGSKADICVMNSCATPGMGLRMEAAKSLSEELFVLQTMGDDRSVSQVYVAGAASKPEAGPHD